MKSYSLVLQAACILLVIVGGNASSLLQRKPHVAGEPDKARSLSQTPQNHAVMVGQTAVLVCMATIAPPNSRIMWGEFITSSGGSIISDNNITLSHPNAARYRIIHTTSVEFHLEIRDVRLSDGGKYVCQNTLGGPPDTYRGEAELIVLDGTTNCTNTAPADGRVIEGFNFTIECVVYYQGGFSPLMTWTGPPPFNLANSPPNPSFVWSGVAYMVDRSMDTRAFECLTNFSDIGQRPPDSASNVPTYSYLYRAPQIFVNWGPKNLFATPIKSFYLVGDVILCTADSNPAAAYQWQNTRTLETFLTRNFTVTADLLGTNQTMRCQAQNVINGFVHSGNIFITVYVPMPTTPTTPTTTPSTSSHPPESDCDHLTGHWRALAPFADLLLELIDDGEMGEFVGLYKNASDTVWVEIIGTVKREDFSLLGLTAIWPFEEGVTSMTGECHRCDGVEVIIGDGMWRSAADSVRCGDGGTPTPHPTYSFFRVGSVQSALADQELDVWKPTHISKKLGVNLKKR